MKTLMRAVSLLLLLTFSANASMLFHLKGTSLTPTVTAGASDHAFYSTGVNTNAVVASNANGFGSSVIDFTSSASSRYLIYTGKANFTSTGTFSAIERIIPLWTGSPSSTQGLFSIGGTTGADELAAWITTSGKIAVYAGNGTSGAMINITSTSTFSFTANTATDIMITWDGTTTSGHVKLYQDGSLVESDTASTTPGATWTNGLSSEIEFGFSGQAIANAVYHTNSYLNEFELRDDVLGSYSPRSGFDSDTGTHGDTCTGPTGGGASVLSTDSYTIGATTTAGTYVGAATSDVRHGTVYGGGTGTAYIPSRNDVRYPVNVDNTTGLAVMPQAATVLTGVTFDTASTGTFACPAAPKLMLGL